MKVIAAKHMYLLGCALSWIAIAVIILVWRNQEHALSYIVNNHIAVYAMLQVATIAFVYCTVRFLEGYFLMHIKGSLLFKRTYFGALALLVAMNVVPSTNESELDAHLALGMVTVLVNVALYIQLSLNQLLHWVLRALILPLVALGVWLFITTENLIAQIIYVLIGQGIIVAIAYVPTVKRPVASVRA